jgi:hypothetical protein
MVRQNLPLFSLLIGNRTLRESSSGARFLYSHKKFGENPILILSNRFDFTSSSRKEL